jgi:hypothetical protein
METQGSAPLRSYIALMPGITVVNIKKEAAHPIFSTAAIARSTKQPKINKTMITKAMLTKSTLLTHSELKVNSFSLIHL